MPKGKGVKSAGGVDPFDPRAEQAEDTTGGVPQVHDLHQTVGGIDPDEPLQDAGPVHTVNEPMYEDAGVHPHSDDLYEFSGEFQPGFESRLKLKAPTPLDGMHQAWCNNDPESINEMMERGYRIRPASTLSKKEKAYRESRGDSSHHIISAGNILMHTTQKNLAVIQRFEDNEHSRLKKASTDMLRDASQAGVRDGADPIEAEMTQRIGSRG